MIFEFILIILIYIPVVYAAYYVTEVKRLPIWLQFPPFHCRKCLTFWSLAAIYTAIGLSFKLMTLFAGGLALTVLTAASMHIWEKKNTVSIDDINIIEED